MIRRSLFLVAIAALVVAATGCDANAGRPPAAIVDGKKISADTVFSDLKIEAAAAKKKGAAAAQSGNPLDSPLGAVSHSYTSAAAAQALAQRVQYLLLGLALADRHVKITTADRTTARQSQCVNPATGQAPTDGSCAALDVYPKEYQTFIVELVARRTAFQSSVVKQVPNRAADARKLYDTVKAKTPSALAVVCFSLAQVADDASGTAIVKATNDGTAFATAVEQAGATKAQLVPQDQCTLRQNLPEDALHAALGTAVGPYTQQGQASVVLLLKSNRTATFAEMQSTLEQQVDTNNSAKITKQVIGLLAAHKVAVDPRFGSWNPKTGTLSPPKGPTAASTSSLPLAAAGG